MAAGMKPDARSRKIALWSKFGVVGGIGFFTEAVILQLLTGAAIVGPYLARCFSFPAAVTLTWALNRRLTFGERDIQDSGRRYLLYVFGQIIGALANLAIYAGTIFAVPALRHVPVAALGCGSLVGLIFNFWWANRVVFKQDAPND
jgi:putative flippase GtrA